MAESAALSVDEVLPAQPMHQWVLSFPFPLCFLFASRSAIMGQVLGILYKLTELAEGVRAQIYRPMTADPETAQRRDRD